MDAYYKNFTSLSLDERRRLNWDHPDAFDYDLLCSDLEALSKRKAIWYVSLAFGVIGVMFFLGSDADLKWKVLAATLVIVSVALQFGLPKHVHFLIPLAIQLVVCGWMALFWQMN